MSREIDDDALRPGDVPEPSADWGAISAFAMTFDGYRAHGSFEACAAVANERRHATLADLRTCLFFEQRRWRHYGDEPDAEAMKYIRELVTQIRSRIAGTPDDPR